MARSPEMPRGHEKLIGGYVAAPMPSDDIGADRRSDYRDAFMPIVFDRISLINRRIMTDCVRDRGLTGIHASYLLALGFKEGLTLVELSRLLDIDAANTNRVVKALREKNLVYDNRTTPKSKKFCIFLTKEGRELTDTIMDEIQSGMDGFFRGIPKTNVDLTRLTLIRMIRNTDSRFQDYIGLGEVDSEEADYDEDERGHSPFMIS